MLNNLFKYSETNETVKSMFITNYDESNRQIRIVNSYKSDDGKRKAYVRYIINIISDIF